MVHSKSLRVFILEDDKPKQARIEKDLKKHNYKIFFFPKNESIFDLMKFSPDILIQDYSKKKIIKCQDWALN